MKEDRTLVASRQDEYQEEFHRVTAEAGFGPGSLIRVPLGRSYDDEGVWGRGYLALVEKIHWNNVDFLIKDTDPSQGWQSRDKKLASARVVSTFGFDPDESSGWNRAPQSGSVEQISLLQLSAVLASAFWPTADFGADSELAISLVGPIKSPSPRPEAAVTPALAQKFSLDPPPRADEYQKERPPYHWSGWSAIRPDEHEEATAKRT